MMRNYKRRINCINSCDNSRKPYLCSDILFHILIRVSPRYLIPLKTVCKQWKNMISGRELSEASLRYWKSRQVISARYQMHAVFVLPKENTNAMNKWIKGELRGRKDSKVVRGHLSWCGWAFSRPPNRKDQRGEMKYISPDGKIYRTLVTACKAQCTWYL